MADHDADRGQEPRGAQGARASRPQGQPPDSRIIRPFSSRQSAGSLGEGSVTKGAKGTDTGVLRVRITAGQWRGRKLEVPEGDAVRPTSDMVRQAIFNILFGHG